MKGALFVLAIALILSFGACRASSPPTEPGDEYVKIVSGEVYWSHSYPLPETVEPDVWLMNDDGARGFVYKLVLSPKVELLKECRYEAKLKLRVISRGGFYIEAEVLEVLDLKKK